jgi:uncharacterized membrane protein YidH (DUF202 family)
MKWIWVIVLVIIGALATFVAIEYFTVAIHALPSFFPGQHAHRRGHYRKRGAVAAVIAILAFLGAAYLAYRVVQADKVGSPAASPAGGGSSADIVGGPPPTPSE